ncbi:hypothetical protein GCM10010488_37130 [Oerskovia jenensis]
MAAPPPESVLFEPHAANVNASTPTAAAEPARVNRLSFTLFFHPVNAGAPASAGDNNDAKQPG